MNDIERVDWAVTERPLRWVGSIGRPGDRQVRMTRVEVEFTLEMKLYNGPSFSYSGDEAVAVALILKPWEMF